MLILLVVGLLHSCSSFFKKPIFKFESEYSLIEFVDEESNKINVADEYYLATPSNMMMLRYLTNRASSLFEDESVDIRYSIHFVPNAFNGKVIQYLLIGEEWKGYSVEMHQKSKGIVVYGDSLDLDNEFHVQLSETVYSLMQNNTSMEDSVLYSEFSNISHDNERIILIGSKNERHAIMYNVSGINRVTTSNNVVDLIRLLEQTDK